jgi:OOP family OmpA-OmpF porin
MKRLRHVIMVVLLLPLVGGCLRFSLETLRQTEAVGDPFTKALMLEYQAFSQSEAEQYDWWDAEKFARKGLKAARGEMVPPEDPSKWDIPKTILPAMMEAREKLITVLSNPDIRKEEPELSARVQAMFDCWVEQQEENWQTEHIDACRNEFYDVLDYLSTPKEVAANVNPSQFEEVVPESEEALPWQKDTAPSPQTVVKALADTKPIGKPATPEVSASYVVFFEFNSTKLTKEGSKIVSQVAKSLKDEKSYEVLLNGYADTTGNAEYNLVLSRRRADAIRQALIKQGIKQAAISLHSFGEDKLAVQTQDGVKEKANRRVEVFIH